MNTEDYKKLIATSNSFSDVLRAFNIKPNSPNSRKAARQRAIQQNISFAHFTDNTSGLRKGRMIKYTLSELLVGEIKNVKNILAPVVLKLKEHLKDAKNVIYISIITKNLNHHNWLRFVFIKVGNYFSDLPSHRFGFLLT